MGTGEWRDHGFERRAYGRESRYGAPGSGTPLRVAFQGALGAFSEEAVLRACGSGAEPVPFRENRDVTRALAEGSVDLGLLPIENTLAGSVHASYDAILAEPAVEAIGEIVLPIHHCVLGLPGSSLDELRVIESHPVALAQCAQFLLRHPRIEARPVYDTAGAASDVAAAADRTRAALASRAAARRYGLEVLADSVEDRPDNQTRFLVLGRTDRRPPFSSGTAVRTMLVVTVPDRPGALLRLLSPLAEHHLNMVKLESRPTGEPWTYRFVVEFEHRADDPAVDAATSSIRSIATTYRSIGTYRPNTAFVP